MTHQASSPGRSRRRIRLFSAAAAFSVLSPVAIYAQVTTAALSGTVQDTANAVVPKATVTLKNTLNGGVRTTISNGAGLFSFAAVPTGDYQVTVTAPGFQQYTATQVHLDPGDQRSLNDIHMSVGSESQNVTVSANTRIDLDSGEQSSLISAQQIKHLSVEGRDVTELLKILPGFAITTGNNNGGDNRAYDPSQVSVNGALGSYAGNGTPLNGVALLTDGADITDPGNFGAAIQNVNYEQVAEVKVQTQSFTADTAHGPVVINAVGKSGGDHFHGSLYTYARTNQLDSNDWIGNQTGQAKAPDREVYPGFTLGGPVYIPRLGFNKSKRLTFFVGAEDYAQRNVYAYGGAGSAILSALVPTQAMRNGDFSQGSLANFLGPIYNPVTDGSNNLPAYAGCMSGNYQNNCGVPQTAPNGSPLVNGNVAPYIDKGAQVLLNNLPLPNRTPTLAGPYNYITTNLVNNDLWEAHARIDDQISDRNKLFMVYTKEAGSSGVPQNEYYSARSGAYGGVNVPGGGLVSGINSEIGSLNFTSVLSPTLTNELFLQGAYLLQNFVAKDQNALNAASAGYPYRGIYANGNTQYPQLQDYSNLPVALTPDTSEGGIYARKWIRGGGDNVTKVFGSHTVKAGIFVELTNNNEVNAFQTANGAVDLYYFGATQPNGGGVFNTGYNTGIGTPAATNNGGNYMANFLEGHIADFNQQNINIHPDLYFFSLAGYVQDHWRVTPRVTLDYGVRFDHLPPWSDTRGDGIPVWNPANYNTDAFNSPLPGFTWHGIDPSVPKSGLATRWAYVEPRVGLAWDVRGDGLTVVRAGYGIYTAHDSFNDATTGIGTSEGQLSSTYSQTTLADASAQNIPINKGSFGTSKVYGFFANDDNQPQVYTYNMAVDQKLIANSVLEVAYVGNRSLHILDNGANATVNLDDQNAIPIGTLYGGNVPATIGAQTAAVSALTAAQQNAFRKYPDYQNVLIGRHRLYANFNALEATWSKQQGHLLYGLNYTFSKALGVLGGDNNGLPSDPFNLRNDYLPETFDRTHMFTANYSYQFGTLVRKRYIGGLTNGWELSGITQIQSGTNAQSSLNPNFGLTGSLGSTVVTGTTNVGLLGTPDVLLQPVVTCDPSIGTVQHQVIRAGCFALPARPGVNGDYRFPYTHLPAYTDTDLTATKNFRIREGSNIQLRFAAFNFINHANSSFVSQYGQETQLNLSHTQDTTQENAATSGNSAFGLAPYREGRRISEVSLEYTF